MAIEFELLPDGEFKETYQMWLPLGYSEPYNFPFCDKDNTEVFHTISDWVEKLLPLGKIQDELQYEADDMDEELEHYRNKEEKQNNTMSMIGLAGASIAKTFLQQNPSILSGIIPAEQLSGILSGNAEVQEPALVNELSEEEQERLDKATALFDWFQAMEKPLFDDVYVIMCVIRQQPAYAGHIVRSINGKGNKNKE